MLKDIEGLSRTIDGFSKFPEVDGQDLKICYSLKPLDLNWLRKIFNVDPNHPDIRVRHMDRKDFKLSKKQGEALQPYIVEEFIDFRLNKEQYEALKPYMIGEIVDFNDYVFYLGTTGGSIKEWDWRDGDPPTQIKNAFDKIEPLIRERTRLFYPPLVIPKKGQNSLALSLDYQLWEDFYKFITNSYQFTEFSVYRIDWDSVKNYKRVSWNRAIIAPKHVKEFLKNTCLNKFKEVAIAYGPKEPIILISLEYICDRFLQAFFEDNWGACFIIGAKRDKYGIVNLIHECFVEVSCGDYLTAPE